jgi:hypothetical protein
MPGEPIPKLRHVTAQATVHKGQRAYVLMDRLQLGDRQYVIPVPLAVALNYLDGRRDIEAICAQVKRDHDIALPPDAVRELIDALDEGCLLDNAAARAAEKARLAAYRAAPKREPLCAGSSYPDDPAELRDQLNRYLAQADATPVPGARAVLSPHIDYARGGVTYAHAWQNARQAAIAAELVIIIGTDHFNGADAITLTRQNYATPLGVLPTDRGAVEALAEAVGQEAAFAGELYHTVEHSLELPLVWLQHMRGSKPVPVAPALVGGVLDEATVRAAAAVIAGLMQQRKVLLVASGDLAHVGPAFDGPALNAAGKAQLREEDAAAMNHLKTGNGDAWWRSLRAAGNPNNVCGLTPFYLALKALGQSHTHALHYSMCPADERGTSVVTICGGVLV